MKTARVDAVPAHAAARPLLLALLLVLLHDRVGEDDDMLPLLHTTTGRSVTLPRQKRRSMGTDGKRRDSAIIREEEEER